jgi:hypothetical protein
MKLGEEFNKIGLGIMGPNLQEINEKAISNMLKWKCSSIHRHT